MSTNASTYTSGMLGKYVVEIVLSAIVSAMFVLIGILSILIGFTKNFIRWTFLGGLFVFITFLVMGISSINTGIENSEGSVTGIRVILIISSIFVFFGAYYPRKDLLGKKLLGIIMEFIGYFLIYSISSYISGFLGILQMLSSFISSIFSGYLSSISGLPLLSFLVEAIFFQFRCYILNYSFYICNCQCSDRHKLSKV